MSKRVTSEAEVAQKASSLYNAIESQAIAVFKLGRHRHDRSGGGFVLQQALAAVKHLFEFRRNRLTKDPELWVKPQKHIYPLRISRGPGYFAPWLSPETQTDAPDGAEAYSVPRYVVPTAVTAVQRLCASSSPETYGYVMPTFIPHTSVYLCGQQTVYCLTEEMLDSIGADISTVIADYKFAKGDVQLAWSAMLASNTYNPVAGFLHSAADALVARHQKPVTEWTEEEIAPYRERVAHFLSDYLHASSHPATAVISRVMLLSAVMRNYEGSFRALHATKHTRPTGPGTDARNMVVLYGPQNQGKSSAITYLSPVPAWAVRVTVDLADIKATGERVGLGWLVELQEIDQQLKGRFASKMKEFLTNPELAFRDAYGRHAKKHPLTCIYIGTTNHDDVLADITASGIERTLIATVCQREDGSEIKARFDDIRRDREKIWEAAVACFLYGDAWDVRQEEERMLAEHQQQYKKRAKFPKLTEEAFRHVLDIVEEPSQVPTELVRDRLIWLVRDRLKEAMRPLEAEVEVKRFAAQRRWAERRMNVSQKLARLLGMGPKERRKVYVIDVGDDLNVTPEGAEDKF